MARFDLGDIVDYGLTALGVGVLAATIGGVGLAPFARPTTCDEKLVAILLNYTGSPLLAQTGFMNITQRVDNDVMIGVMNGTENVGYPARPGGIGVQLGGLNMSIPGATYTGCLVQIGAVNIIGKDQHGRGTRVYPLLNVRCAPEPAERAER